MGEIRFDSLDPIEEPAILGGQSYTLREISGDGRVKMDNARTRCYEYGPDGKLARVNDLANLEPLLVSLCLYDPSGNPVPEDVVRAWPARVQRALYDRARMLNGTDETKESIEKQISLLQEQLREMESREQAVKNSQNNSTGG